MCSHVSMHVGGSVINVGSLRLSLSTLFLMSESHTRLLAQCVANYSVISISMPNLLKSAEVT